MIRSFRNRGTEDMFHARRTKAASKVCPPELWAIAKRKMDRINQADILDDLRVPPRNRLETLRGDRKGQHSIRINRQYRVCFTWTDAGPEAVEIVDYHS